MIQEEKDLLFRDLCARIPRAVKVKAERIHKDSLSFVGVDDNSYICKTPSGSVICIPFNFDVKPYLRPMSSITEEEQKEFAKFHCVNICPIVIVEELTISNEAKMFDWLNAHHFDYRGLIEKGLALSTEMFNPYKD